MLCTPRGSVAFFCFVLLRVYIVNKVRMSVLLLMCVDIVKLLWIYILFWFNAFHIAWMNDRLFSILALSLVYGATMRMSGRREKLPSTK